MTRPRPQAPAAAPAIRRPAGRPPTARERRATRTVTALLDRIRVGALRVRLPDGRSRTFGDPAAARAVDLEVHDWRFFARLVTGASVGLGESYVDGDWTTPDLVSLVGLLIANRESLRHVPPGALVSSAGDLAVHALRTNRPGRAKRNIAAHYDLSNDLYATFLDPTMTYSAAWFEHPDVDLETAQVAKYRRLAELARIGPGHRVLEVGCGWGGFALFAATTYDCHVTGITLSEEQASLARRRIREAGLEDRIDIRVVDYRHVGGRFDRIISIEMLEAVGHRFLRTYFAALDRLLAPDGLVAIQTITIPEQRYDAYRRRPDFIQRHVFPGGHLPSLEAIAGAAGSASRLVVEDVTNLAPHYAETLRRWRRAFLADVDEVRALGFDDAFVRYWEFYLAYCEAAFAARYIGDLQILLARPGTRSLGSAPYAGPHPPLGGTAGEGSGPG